MRIILSAAVSKDGYLDDTSEKRLVISNQQDWAQVYALRAAADAILVGAQTVRKDNPALVIRDGFLREHRTRLGMKPDMVKVTVTDSCDLDPGSRFFTEGCSAAKIIITSERTDSEKNQRIERLSRVARIIKLPTVDAGNICTTLEAEGINTLMVEGGAQILDMFLSGGMVDMLRVAKSKSIEVSDPEAPRIPWQDDGDSGTNQFDHNVILREMHKLGDMEVRYYLFERGRELRTTETISSHIELAPETITYADRILNDIGEPADLREDYNLLLCAVEISRKCPPSETAYSVGCVIKTFDGRLFEGYSRETGPHNHAEEEAILKAREAGADLWGATLYTSMEPCSTRKSKPVSCTEIIIGEQMRRVVYAYAEPDHFVRCEGTTMLKDAGIEVCSMPLLSSAVVAINSHILAPAPFPANKY